jgi:hypothetical protein
MLPQLPQFIGSVWVLVQTPPHIEFGAEQTQVLFTQTSPGRQTLPQLPQCFWSRFVCVHTPEHIVPPVHGLVQPLHAIVLDAQFAPTHVLAQPVENTPLDTHGPQSGSQPLPLPSRGIKGRARLGPLAPVNTPASPTLLSPMPAAMISIAKKVSPADDGTDVA